MSVLTDLINERSEWNKKQKKARLGSWIIGGVQGLLLLTLVVMVASWHSEILAFISKVIPL